MAFVRMPDRAVRDKGIGKRIVPIVPDEARTFGMEGCSASSASTPHVGQLYEPSIPTS